MCALWHIILFIFTVYLSCFTAVPIHQKLKAFYTLYVRPVVTQAVLDIDGDLHLLVHVHSLQSLLHALTVPPYMQ